jgi:hypothetical protein
MIYPSDLFLFAPRMPTQRGSALRAMAGINKLNITRLAHLSLLNKRGLTRGSYVFLETHKNSCGGVVENKIKQCC